MPEVIVLGFSKGPTQAGALSSQPHDQIAFRGGRTNLAKILHHVGLLETPSSNLVNDAIADRNGRFHFASLIRCTVERFDPKKNPPGWLGTGGGMLDKFVARQFGESVLLNCSKKFLSELPVQAKLILMLGLGADGNYVVGCKRAFEAARPGAWRNINGVSYSDGKVVVVHTEHFKAQGAHLGNWLSGDAHQRGQLGMMAREGVAVALGKS